MQYKILKAILNFIYLFLKLLPINKNKVVFISRQSDVPNIDFILLKKEILKINPNYKVVMICKKIKKSKTDMLKYFSCVIRQMYNLATAKTCVTDGYNVSISLLKHKKELEIIQIWHAIATVKQFGYQTLDKKYGRSKGIAESLNMHKGYDYVISGSEAMKPIFAKTFNISKKKIKTFGTPRIDYILNNCNNISKSILKDYPMLRKKKNILYAPTFRRGEKINIDELLKTIDMNKYNLIVKCHPSKTQNFDNDSIYKCEEYTSMQLLTISDYVITDYSAISIEAALLDRPVYFYLYDYELYKKNNGLNIDLKKEMQNYCFKNFKNLYKKIESNNYNYGQLKKYRDKYVDNQNKTATNILANYIINNKWN